MQTQEEIAMTGKTYNFHTIMYIDTGKYLPKKDWCTYPN